MDTKVVDNLIVGRVEPRIYAFTTNTVPNYLKVGDTYRPVSVRLKEWEIHFPKLKKQFEESAKVNDDVFFRDYAIHQFLEQDLGRERLTPDKLPEGTYFSNEFFKSAKANDVEKAIVDIKKDFEAKTEKYSFYSTRDSLPVEEKYASTGLWELRDNQAAVVKAFKKAVENKRTNLLMYAVMRFGKSFTSLCCAKAMNDEKGAKLVVVVSAKADVKDEWRKTVQSADNFNKDYEFLSSENLNRNHQILTDTLKKKKVVLFLTLQDLQGDNIKEKHEQLFTSKVDLLIVDESHFGARAEKYGEILRNKDASKDLDKDDFSFEKADAIVKQFHPKVTIHLSGTPYRILMGSEFEKEDIIAFCQFTDIVKAQKEWDDKHLLEDVANGKPRNEWDNPYYGFPQMIRFAFNPNESSLKKMEALKAEGKTAKISALFEPEEGKKGMDAAFIHEKEVLDLLQIIDGSKSDSNILSFLNYDKLKEGKMCRHIVFVLPRCASCDALDNLIRKNDKKFRNLQTYEILNISGEKRKELYKEPKDVKRKIHEFEVNGSKTITLTVNRMLTGSTVEEWDTMIYLKDSSSPQEYDQAIFRLQNQYVKTIRDKDGNEIKLNMKPQTLLVDFDPARMFSMQELKSQIYNVNVDKAGNSKLSERIDEELAISPIVYFNNGKIDQVKATDILNIVSEYSQNRGVAEETNEIPVDLGLMENQTIWNEISKQNELGSKSGFTVKPNEGDGDDLDIPDTDSEDGSDDETGKNSTQNTNLEKDDKDKKDPVKQFRMYYARILFYAFLTKTEIISLEDLIGSLSNPDNLRICKNLGLNKNVLVALNKGMNKFMLRKLDYKIQHLNTLAHDDSIDSLQRALVANQKFGRISDSEIVTPSKVADEMVAQLPKKLLQECIKNKAPILDIASKEGEFAIALCKWFKKNGVKPSEYKNLVYSIPTSSVAYEFTRKVYEVLGLNVACIAEQFNSYDLLNVKNAKGNDLDYEKIKQLLGQKKKFNEISLSDKVSGEVKVNFSAVVGNPPYHEENATNGRKPPIYHLFMSVSYILSPFAIMITPARFLFEAGQTPQKWNEKMLADEAFRIANYERDAAKIFDNAEIKGGVAISLRSQGENFGKIGVFSAYKELNKILQRVKKVNGDAPYMESIISSQGVCKFTSEALRIHPEISALSGDGTKEKIVSKVVDAAEEIFKMEVFNGSLAIIAKGKAGRIIRYVDRTLIQENVFINTYNVLIPESNGSGAFDVFSSPEISRPNEIFADTFIGIGSFVKKSEAENAHKYIKTKFARAMLGLKKVTQHNPKTTWSYVPLQDFTKNSDIDWSKPINEIDTQLYAKYHLTKEEINFIETHVKGM